MSVEGEFAFTKVVGDFLREEVRVGSFKGNYVLNLKEKMRMMSLRDGDEEKKIKVLLVGVI